MKNGKLNGSANVPKIARKPNANVPKTRPKMKNGKLNGSANVPKIKLKMRNAKLNGNGVTLNSATKLPTSVNRLVVKLTVLAKSPKR